MSTTSNSKVIVLFSGCDEKEVEQKINTIKKIDETINKGGDIVTSIKEDCAYITQQIIERAKERVFIVINKRSPSETLVYENESVLEAISDAFRKGVSVYVIFSQFEHCDDILSSELFKILKKASERFCLVECLNLESVTPDIDKDHLSFVFADKIGSRVKNELGHSTSHFDPPKTEEPWINFLINHFEWIRSASKRIPLA